MTVVVVGGVAGVGKADDECVGFMSLSKGITPETVVVCLSLGPLGHAPSDLKGNNLACLHSLSSANSVLPIK